MQENICKSLGYVRNFCSQDGNVIWDANVISLRSDSILVFQFLHFYNISLQFFPVSYCNISCVENIHHCNSPDTLTVSPEWDSITVFRLFTCHIAYRLVLSVYCNYNDLCFPYITLECSVCNLFAEASYSDGTPRWRLHNTLFFIVN